MMYVSVTLTETQQNEAAAARRKRLMGTPVKEAPKPVQPLKKIVVVEVLDKDSPLWKTGLLLFDAHVSDYQGAVFGSSREFIRHTCRAAGFRLEYLKGSDRNHIIVCLRAYIAAALRDRFNLSFTQIGKALGRHHTSIIHMLNVYGTDEEAIRSKAFSAIRKFDSCVAMGLDLDSFERVLKIDKESIYKLAAARGVQYRERAR